MYLPRMSISLGPPITSHTLAQITLVAHRVPATHVTVHLWARTRPVKLRCAFLAVDPHFQHNLRPVVHLQDFSARDTRSTLWPEVLTKSLARNGLPPNLSYVSRKKALIVCCATSWIWRM